MKWILFLILFFLSCITSKNTAYSNYEIAYIDGCQYIITEQGGITHKANCSNSYHK